MFCTKCGHEIADGAKFCVACGAKLDDDANAKNEARGVAAKRLSTEEKKKSKVWIPLLIVLLLIALLGGAVYTIGFTEVGQSIVEKILGNDDAEDTSDSDKPKKSKKTKKSSDAEAESETTTESETETDEYDGPKQDISIEISQIDSASFPSVTMYASLLDTAGNVIEGVTDKDLTVKEITDDGSLKDVDIEDVYRMSGSDKISMNLVLDQSGSMDGGKMNQAKSAAKTLIGNVNLKNGDKLEIISFDDYVYLKQDFTSDETALNSAIDAIDPNGSTALLDALYAGLYQTYKESGARCVVGFTDGEENASSYTYEDVVELSRNTGIPVYLIGIGDSSYDSAELQNLAEECAGRYYSVNDSDLESILSDIYMEIYKQQQDYYLIKYKSQISENLEDFKDVTVEMSEVSKYAGKFTKSYVPTPDVTGAFDDKYMDKDYMIADSSNRKVTEADLDGMGLSELRIARNEIFARHGRQFKDPMLNQWFYSKEWYLDIPEKYSPDEFNASNGKSISKLENENADFILKYENDLIDREDIFPDAASSDLSEYDLALSKENLKRALKQMQGYTKTEKLEENIKKVQEQIDADEIQY